MRSSLQQTGHRVTLRQQNQPSHLGGAELIPAEGHEMHLTVGENYAYREGKRSRETGTTFQWMNPSVGQTTSVRKPGKLSFEDSQGFASKILKERRKRSFGNVQVAEGPSSPKNATIETAVTKKEGSRYRKGHKRRGRARKGRKGGKKRKSGGFPPKYMLDIYHAFSELEEGRPAANVVRGFRHINKGMVIIKFNYCKLTFHRSYINRFL